MNRIIISDTSCLIALGNIELLGILKDLYNEIIITYQIIKRFRQTLIIEIFLKTLRWITADDIDST